MNDPLYGPRLKIQRAKSRIRVLRSIQDEFRAQCDYRVVVAELDTKRQQFALRALVNILPPSDLGLCIGEVAHNLRSALDGLVYQLGKLNEASERDLTRTQFPIFLKQRFSGCVGKCQRRPPHYRCSAKRYIEPLKQKHKTAIERWQPYRYGNLGKRSPLYLLHELNNADKHRLLQVAGGNVAGYFAGAAWGRERFPDYRITLHQPVEDGARIGRVRAADVRGRRVRREQKIPALIAFWKGCPAVEGRGVTYILSQMEEKVSEIVESFEPEFS